MKELKIVYINVTKHNLESQEFMDFVEYMREEDIEVRTGVPDRMIVLEGECKPVRECALVITDYDESVSDIDIAVAGYGVDYAGVAAYVIENLDVWVSYLRMVFARFAKQPFEVTKTKRLIIREMTLKDLPKMYELYESIKDCPYVEPLYAWDEEYEFCEKYIENMYTFFGYGLWLVFEKDTGELVGRIGIENRTIDGELCRELGYLIRKDRQGRGYVTEALMAVLDYATRQLCLKEMFICTHMDNVPSMAVAKKLGFEIYDKDIDGMNLYKKMLQ